MNCRRCQKDNSQATLIIEPLSVMTSQEMKAMDQRGNPIVGAPAAKALFVSSLLTVLCVECVESAADHMLKVGRPMTVPEVNLWIADAQSQEDNVVNLPAPEVIPTTDVPPPAA